MIELKALFGTIQRCLCVLDGVSGVVLVDEWLPTQAAVPPCRRGALEWRLSDQKNYGTQKKKAEFLCERWSQRFESGYLLRFCFEQSKDVGKWIPSWEAHLKASEYGWGKEGMYFSFLIAWSLRQLCREPLPLILRLNVSTQDFYWIRKKKMYVEAVEWVLSSNFVSDTLQTSFIGKQFDFPQIFAIHSTLTMSVWLLNRMYPLAIHYHIDILECLRRKVLHLRRAKIMWTLVL